LNGLNNSSVRRACAPTVTDNDVVGFYTNNIAVCRGRARNDRIAGSHTLCMPEFQVQHLHQARCCQCNISARGRSSQ